MHLKGKYIAKIDSNNGFEVSFIPWKLKKTCILGIFVIFSLCIYRGIAQSGSAPALGAGCRGFKSLYPEYNAPVAQLDRASAF